MELSLMTACVVETGSENVSVAQLQVLRPCPPAAQRSVKQAIHCAPSEPAPDQSTIRHGYHWRAIPSIVCDAISSSADLLHSIVCFTTHSSTNKSERRLVSKRDTPHRKSDW
jgi:hypothetical protein